MDSEINKMRQQKLTTVMLVCTLIGLLSLRAMSGENYPNRPVTIIVPFARGGYTDILGRYAAAVLHSAVSGRTRSTHTFGSSGPFYHILSVIFQISDALAWSRGTSARAVIER
jgi:hypothetical protein